MNAPLNLEDCVTVTKYEPQTEPPKEKRSKPILLLPTPYSGAPTPPRAWLFGQHYIRGFVSGTFAPGARGKSSHVLLDAVEMLALPADA